MNSEFIWQATASAIATYAVHSTLLLATAWILDRSVKTSAVVREWLWKWSAIIPLASTAFVLLNTQAQPVWEWHANVDGTPEFVAHELVNRQAVLGAARSIEIADRRESFNTQNVNDPVGELQADATTTTANVSTNVALGSITNKADDVESSQPNQNWTLEIVPAIASNQALPKVAAKKQQFNDHETVVETGSSDTNHKQNRLAANASDRRRILQNSSDTSKKPTQPISTALLPQSLAARRASLHRPTSVLCRLIVIAAAGLCLFGIMHFILTTIRINQILRASRPLKEGRVFEQLTELLADRQIRRTVRLLSSDTVSEPAAIGVLRWTIILPTDLSSALSDSELSALLCHELGHLVRRDTCWLVFGRVLTAILPWQMLNFVAVRRWQQAAELECDQWALGSNIQAITLAKVLASVAEWKNGTDLGIGLPATAPPLSLRIETLLNRSSELPKPRSRRRRIVQTAVVTSTLLTASVFGPRMTWAVAETDNSKIDIAEASSDATTAQAEQLLELQVELQDLSADLHDAMLLLAEQDPDPVVEEVIHQINDRLKKIEARILQKGFEQ